MKMTGSVAGTGLMLSSESSSEILNQFVMVQYSGTYIKLEAGIWTNDVHVVL